MPLETDDERSEPIKRVLAHLANFETDEGRLKGISFLPLPTDVIISTTAKAGTTNARKIVPNRSWMQQIVHQLRTGGDMNFGEISEVVPWLEMASDQGQDLNAPQPFPRCFKSHLWYPHIPKSPTEPCKYIVVLRDPYDVALSFFNFFQGWFFQPGDLDVTAFVSEFLLKRGPAKTGMSNASYWHHLLSWWEVREQKNVLILFYEDLKLDLKGSVRRVAEFIGIEAEVLEKRVDTATEMATFEFMKKHEDHFDERLAKIFRNEAMGLPKDAGMKGGKIGKGTSGAGSALSDELKKLMDQKWQDVLSEATGATSYPELLALSRRGKA